MTRNPLWAIWLLTLLAPSAWAHPGHPAMSATHAHVFGVDPVWLAVLGTAAAGVALAACRLLGRSRART